MILFSTGVSFDLSDKELFCIEEQVVFDRVYSLIKGYSVLPPSCKFNLVESLRSNLSVLLPNVDSISRVSQDHNGDSPILDRVGSHRNAFKIYTFFLFSVIIAEESKVGSNNNSKVLARCLLAIYLYLSIYLSVYLSCFVSFFSLYMHICAVISSLISTIFYCQFIEFFLAMA